MVKRFLLILSFVSFINTGFCQELAFEQLGVEDGLPHYYTEYVYEDSKGYLWVGTIGGLVKYDGIHMKLKGVYLRV